MTRPYLRLLRLYPTNIRLFYGDEMVATFEKREALARLGGRLAMARFTLTEIWRLLPDAACERIARLSSHPSFRGRCQRDLGVVRPPDIGKREWFYDASD